MLRVQRRQRADFHSAPVFGDESLGQFQCLLLHLDGFLGVNQIEVSLLYVRHRGNDLQPDIEFRDFDILFVEIDLQARGINPEILQQRLPQRQCADIPGGRLEGETVGPTGTVP